VHLLAGLLIVAIGIGPRQIVKDHLDGLQTQSVREVVVPGAGVALDGMGQGIHPCVSGDLGRQPGHEGRVNDGDVGHILAGAQNELPPVFSIGQDHDPGDFGSGAAGGGDGNEPGLLAQAQRDHGIDLFWLHVGTLVEDPHSLGRIHGGTAPQADDPIGAVLAHGRRTPLHYLQRRVGLDLGKDLRFCPGLFQLLDD
jgi:hypothetical protein